MLLLNLYAVFILQKNENELYRFIPNLFDRLEVNYFKQNNTIVGFFSKFATKESNTMKITLYQQDIVWLDPEANYRKVEALLASSPESDLLVLPEMFTTGFVTHPKPGSLESDASVRERLSQLAARYDCALAGSVAIEDAPGIYRNRFYFVQPDGRIDYADKRHLFSFGGEHLVYKPGDRRVVVEYKGVRFLLLVCYDLRFPVWARCLDDYDVLLLVANWPDVRQYSWEILLKARAIENQCYAVGVNRVGKDQLCAYAGGSMALHFYGHPIAAATSGEEQSFSFEPELEPLRHFREKFPVMSDSDRFEIQL